jgi:hypothetical protein
MPNYAVLPTVRHPVCDCSASDPLAGTYCESKNEEPHLGRAIFSEPIDFLFDGCFSGLVPHPPNPPVESTEWESIPPPAPGAFSPPHDETLGCIDVVGAVPATYPIYSVGTDTPVTTFRFSYHASARTYLPLRANLYPGLWINPQLLFPLSRRSTRRRIAIHSASFGGLDINQFHGRHMRID